MKKKAVVMVVGLWLGASFASGALAADDPGKAIFGKSCVGCHGANGKGNPAMAKMFGEKELNIVDADTVKKSDDQLLKTIAEGAGKMPAQKKLSKDERTQVLSYVRSLAKK